jgi:rare lipoprotein A
VFFLLPSPIKRSFNLIPLFSLIALLYLLGGCSIYNVGDRQTTQKTASPKRATSRPYVIKGIRYYPLGYYEHEEIGLASYYGGKDGTHGLPTATGDPFCMFSMTAAHKTLPLPCVIRVTNLKNGRKVILKVNDRGPFKHKRILDVSRQAAKALGFERDGTTRVHLVTLVQESLALPENRKAQRSKNSLVSQRSVRQRILRPATLDEMIWMTASSKPSLRPPIKKSSSQSPKNLESFLTQIV